MTEKNDELKEQLRRLNIDIESERKLKISTYKENQKLWGQLKQAQAKLRRSIEEENDCRDSLYYFPIENSKLKGPDS